MCKISRLHLRALGMASILGLFLPPTDVRSAEFTWVGAVNGNWSEALNWDAGPPADATDTTLVFGAAGPETTTNDLAGGLTLNALTIGADSGARNFQGNALTFAGTAPTLRMLGTAGDAFFTQSMTLDSTLAVSGGPTFGGQLLLAGNLSGTGGVHFTGGVSVVSGTNSFTGATTIGAGAVHGVLGGGLAGTSGVTVEAGGELRIERRSATLATVVNRPLNLAGALTSDSSRNVDLVFGSASVSTSWSGAVTLGGDASFEAFGGTEFDLVPVTLGISGAVDLNGHELTLRATGFNNEVRVTGAISGDGDVRVIDTAGGGTVSIASLAGEGKLSVAMAGDGLAPVTVTGNITGNRDIELNRGMLTLSGAANTFTGAIVVDGTDGLSLLSVSSSTRLGDAANTVTLRNGGGLQITSSETVAQAVHLDGGGSLLGPNVGVTSRTYTGNITGAGGLTLSRGSFTLSGENTFTGRFTALGASGQPTTIVAASAGNLGGADSPMTLGASNLTPVTLRAIGDLDFAATPTTTFSNLTVDTNGHDVTFNQAMSGAGLVKNGEGVLTFAGLTDSGATTNFIALNAGVLRLGADNALGQRVSIQQFASGAVLDLDGHDLSATISGDNVGSRILLGAGTLTLRGGFISADISGTGGLVLAGGTTELNGANTFTGTTRVLAGTLGGGGSLAGDLVITHAELAPGSSAGLFEVAGTIMASSATFVFELGGTIRGDDYDALSLGGTLDLTGGDNALSLSFIAGFETSIQFTDTFDLVMGSGLAGDFFNVANGERLFTADGLGSFVVNYGAESPFGANNVVLSEYLAVGVIPEPSSTTLLGALAADTMAAMSRRPRRAPSSS